MNQYDGFLAVDKEAGYTSHDVVAKLRGILKMKKIGHAGTLDPDATGVLLVCLGRATKLSARMMESEKEYFVRMLLGRVTDTQDVSGKILSERTPVCTGEEVESAIMSFEGGYDQIPPMYSAKKVNGKKLYEYAREGIEIERKPEKVEIPQISIVKIELPYVEYKVRCSKGTYIRTLCNDIGEKLGCGACMEKLRRTSAGGFSIEETHSLSEIEEAARTGAVQDMIVPIDEYI